MRDTAGSVAVDREVIALPPAGGDDSRRILLVQHASDRTGSTISGLMVAEAFREIGAGVDVAFGHEGPMIAAYEQRGCRTHVVPHKNWLRGGNWHQSLRRMAREYQNARRFRTLLQELRPDVVYVNSLVSLSAVIAARRERIPCVWHLRELFDDVGGEMHLPAFGGRPLVRQILKQLPTRRIAISHSVAENVLGKTDNLQFDIVPNAADESFFSARGSAAECRRQFELPDGRPIIGIPGTLRPIKGHAFLLNAAAHVIRTIPECLFAITGSGEPDYEAQLRSQAASLGIEEQVRFVGTVTEMPQFYRACQLVCVPSRSESFGRIVIEAFATGTPVVATAVGGMRETVDNGRTGLLVDYGDVAGLAAAISRLLSDERTRTELATNAARVAGERYSARQCRERLRKIVLPMAAPESRCNQSAVNRDSVVAAIGARPEAH